MKVRKKTILVSRVFSFSDLHYQNYGKMISPGMLKVFLCVFVIAFNKIGFFSSFQLHIDPLSSFCKKSSWDHDQDKNNGQQYFSGNKSQDLGKLHPPEI